MPHQCTECGYTFPDGSKEMLSGCPDCGGTKFQYHPDAVPDDPGDPTPPEREDAGVSGAVGRAADTVRDVFGSDSAGSRSEPDPGASDSPPEREDPAQADARSEVVDASDLPAADSTPDADADLGSDTRSEHSDAPADAAPGGEGASGEDTPEPAPEGTGEVVSAPDEDAPELADLREELNDQFESIRIVEPGQYELNLMELYDREEYIIALQENGRYVIEVPDAWRDDSEV